MQTVTITTPDNIEIQYRLAGVGSRLAAAVIDSAVQVSAALAVTLALLFGVMGFRFSEAASFHFSGPPLAILIISYFFILFGYFFVSEMAMNGQSLGKRIFGLRVIRENGRPIGLWHSIIRNLFRYVVDMTGFGVAAILFSQKNRRIGDMLASTVVVAENRQLSAASFGSGLPPSADGAQILYENLRLSDEERACLKEYMFRRFDLLDGGEYLRGRFISYFARRFDVPESMVNEETLEKILRLNL